MRELTLHELDCVSGGFDEPQEQGPPTISYSYNPGTGALTITVTEHSSGVDFSGGFTLNPSGLQSLNFNIVQGTSSFSSSYDLSGGYSGTFSNQFNPSTSGYVTFTGGGGGGSVSVGVHVDF